MKLSDPNEGQHRGHMDAAIREGATPGNPDGPDWLTGCAKCSYGIVAQPDLWSIGVPPFIARAMALDLDGICYTVYCDCKAGEGAMSYDQQTRHRLDNQLESTSIIQGKDEYGHKRIEWGGDAPADCIPGSWWAKVREVCQAKHFGGE